MVEGGLLDVDHELKTATSDEDFIDVLEQWQDRSMALTSFLKNSDWMPLLFKDGSELSIPVFKAEDEFKSIFHQSASRMMQSFEGLTDHLSSGRVHPNPGFYCNANLEQGGSAVIGRWMAAACLMDSPQTLQMLVQKSPQAALVEFALEELGDPFFEYTRSQNYVPPPALEEVREDAIRVTPAFVALMLARVECLDVLQSAHPEQALSLGSVYDGGERDKFDVFSMSSKDLYAPVCPPEAFTHALNLHLQTLNYDSVLKGENYSNEDVFALADLHVGALNDLHSNCFYMRPYVDSFLESKIFEGGLPSVITQAVAHGHSNVIEHFRGRIPWDEILPQSDEAKAKYPSSALNPIYAAAMACGNDNASTDEIEKSVLLFLDLATQDSKLHEVLAFGPNVVSSPTTLDPADEKNVIEPIFALADAGFNRIIVKFLENGLDPHAKMGVDTPSVMETADLKSNDLAQTIRTFMNRKRAFAALNGMDLFRSSPSPSMTDFEKIAEEVKLARSGNGDALAILLERLDGGLLDAEEDKSAWFDLFLNTFDEVQFKTEHNHPNGNPYPAPVRVAMAHSSPSFAVAIEKVFDAMVSQDKASLETGVEPGDEFRSLRFAKAMALSCAMGMPSSVAALAVQCPEALRLPLTIDVSSKGGWGSHCMDKAAQAVYVPPAFFAIQFGQAECLKALKDAGLERQFSPAYEADLHRSSSVMGIPFLKDSPLIKKTGISQTDFFSFFELSVRPDRLGPLLAHMDHAISWTGNPAVVAMGALKSPKIADSLRSFLPVFMNEGTMEKLNAQAVLKLACLRNITEVVDFYKDRMPWNDLDSGLITELALSLPGEGEDAALLALLSLAKAQGQMHMFALYVSDALEHVDPSSDPNHSDVDVSVEVTQPVYSVIQANMKHTLVAMLENGLVPDERDDSGVSAMDLAVRHRKPEMVQVMHSFKARSMAMGLLDDFFADESSHAKKGTSP